MKKFFADFKQFIMRGNVVDMAVGVIIGGAFTKIVNSMVNDIFTPLINLATGSADLTGFKISLNGKPLTIIDATTGLSVPNPECISMNLGNLIDAIMNFLMVAIILFIIIKVVARMKKIRQKIQNEIHAKEIEEARLAEEAKRKALEEAARNAPKVPTTEELLMEIRDLLKK